jgi:FdhD protein
MSAADLIELDFAGPTARPISRDIASECPVALEFNGVAYAVMMASPEDVEDFVTGFALAEGLIGSAEELLHLSCHTAEHGVIARAELAPERAAPLLERVRVRLVEGSCGLCGLESIDQVMRPLPRLVAAFRAGPDAVRRALDDLPDHQPRGFATGAMHAAAFCAPDGAIRLVREDVGRHNALDKLIGALARAGIDPAGGFILVSARCSYELVEKAVRAGCPMLVAISAPTSLAVERARSADLTLIALARHDTMLVVHDPHAMMNGGADGL